MVKTTSNLAGITAKVGNILGFSKECPVINGFCNKIIGTNRRKVFLAEQYDENRKDREKAIIEVLDEMDLILELADDEIKNRALFCKVCEQMQSSYICVIDITEQNHNVLIELGMAYGFQKPTILIFEESQKEKIKIPTDVQGIEYIDYKDYDDLKERLKSSLKTILKGKPSIIHSYHILEGLKKDLKLLMELEELENIPIINDFKIISGEKKVILKGGQDYKIKKGMIFDIHKVQEGIIHEKEVGFIEITDPQPKLSLGKIHYVNLDYKKEIDELFEKKSSEISFILKKIEHNISKKEIEELKRTLACLGILV
ncbi:TIR domain-containing protein [Methanobacterium sp. ACI-7]|uniref:TIR domain-containing protein n=1 Tax=unclassified Methanobacterium TaxID=2627676 RepID=UPI0039C2FA56